MTLLDAIAEIEVDLKTTRAFGPDQERILRALLALIRRMVEET